MSRRLLVLSLLLLLPSRSDAANLSGKDASEIIPVGGSAGVGTGDIESVGNCASGGCPLADSTFGSGGTFTWTFNAGATDPTLALGSGTMTLTPGGSDLTIADDVILSDATPSLTITGGGRSYHLDGSGNMFRLADTTSGVDSLVINSAGQVTQLAGWRHPPAESYWLASRLDQIEHAADGFPVLTKNAGTNVDVYTLDHDDTARECSGGTYQVPSEADPNGTVPFLVEWFPATPQTKSVVWSVNHVARRGGQSWDAALTAVTSNASTASATANVQQDAIWTASMATLGWKPNQLILFEVCREPSNSGDTLVGDAKLIGFGFSTPRNKPGNP